MMKTNYKIIFMIAATLLINLFWHYPKIKAQTEPLTYPVIITALNTKLPNKNFKKKSELRDWLIAQIEQRKLEKTLTQEMEETLRESGADYYLISIIRKNSPIPNYTLQPKYFYKQYQVMSDAEKSEFIEYKVEEFIAKYESGKSSKISAEGMKFIKQNIDEYLKRFSTTKITTIGANNFADSDNNCDFGKSDLREVLKRKEQYRQIISNGFREWTFSPEIGINLALAKSEFCPCLKSAVGPLGMFQFTRYTALLHGLKVAENDEIPSEENDARCDPQAAARAAAEYTSKDLFYGINGRDGDRILLTILAYSLGEGSVRQAAKEIRNLGVSNVSVWEIIEYRNQLSKVFAEEYMQVPKFLAAMIISENTKLFETAE